MATQVQNLTAIRPKRCRKRGIPYEGATSGEGARAQATKWLRRLGCEQIGFMDEARDI
jgi:hypothetical protein